MTLNRLEDFVNAKQSYEQAVKLDRCVVCFIYLLSIYWNWATAQLITCGETWLNTARRRIHKVSLIRRPKNGTSYEQAVKLNRCAIRFIELNSFKTVRYRRIFLAVITGYCRVFVYLGCHWSLWVKRYDGLKLSNWRSNSSFNTATFTDNLRIYGVIERISQIIYTSNQRTNIIDNIHYSNHRTNITDNIH